MTPTWVTNRKETCPETESCRLYTTRWWGNREALTARTARAPTDNQTHIAARYEAKHVAAAGAEGDSVAELAFRAAAENESLRPQLAIPQRRHDIDPSRPPRREVAGRQRRQQKDSRGDADAHQVERRHPEKQGGDGLRYQQR